MFFQKPPERSNRKNITLRPFKTHVAAWFKNHSINLPGYSRDWFSTGGSNKGKAIFTQVTTQLVFTCSELIIETLEHEVKYVQS